MSRDMNDFFAENMKKLRKVKNITLMDLAKVSLVNHSILSQFERRKIDSIPKYAKKKIAESLGVSIEWLYSSGDEKRKMFISEVDRLSNEGSPENLNKAEKLVNKQLEEAITVEEKAISLSQLSKVKIRNADFIGAKECCEKLIKLLDKSTGSLIHTAYFNLCLSHYFLKNYEKVVCLVDKTKELESKDYETAKAAHLAGCAYVEIGKVNKALKEFDYALNIYKKLGKKDGERQIIHNFGNIYELKGDLEKAREYYKQSYQFSLDLDDKYSLFEAGVDYCKTCLITNQIDECRSVIKNLSEKMPCHPVFESIYWYLYAMMIDDKVERESILTDRLSKLKESDRGGYYDLKFYMSIELARLFAEKGDYLQSIQYYEIANSSSLKIIEKHKRRNYN